MKNLLLAALLLFTVSSCALKPVNKHDVFNERAQLPQEEAVHKQNSLEWWYFTGHLRDKATGEVFGVEYVFFHFNLTGKKDWQMVNFAITDPQQQQFRYDYKVERLPQLMATSLPINLSTQKKAQRWTLDGQEGSYHLQARMAEHTGHAIDLQTSPVKPVLLHGGTGYEKYGPVAQAGYYSYPRMAAAGTLEVNGKVHQVEGELWYDRQWNCNSVTTKDIGWDWFSIQLEEPKEEIMAYQLYNKATGESIGGGSHYGAQAQNTHLEQKDFQLEPLAYWTSPHSKQRYPNKWRLRIPSQGYDLTITPVMADQELTLKLFAGIKMHYWEGMCRVEGTHNGNPVTGNSYVEITNRSEVKKAREAVEEATEREEKASR
ncbi:Predicted secreted hydrolase [Hymenobacter gelipurpurascens]|uniref:Predicted secreted hydrolase n=1 Tax=Hymenobacter gelipurpurascens TaxID=89968 RepID=A0A212UGJ2_9BACT|nr:lipocalin family protein [Hymenobacter gelipurpurascens]SNC77174.1 Predicted secreted hydrolase [Hymenobacter gelipurpurascens]